MAFKLTYSDGQESDYDDDTAWEVDNGVLKMGREDGKWTVLVSPSHWAVVELIPSPSGKDKGDDDGDGDGDDSDGAKAEDSDSDSDSGDDEEEKDEKKD
jgi:hypothetical protein